MTLELLVSLPATFGTFWCFMSHFAAKENSRRCDKNNQSGDKFYPLPGRSLVRYAGGRGGDRLTRSQRYWGRGGSGGAEPPQWTNSKNSSSTLGMTEARYLNILISRDI